MDNVSQIKEKIDIVDLVGSFISLAKTGENFKGRCPFHNEKTASFFVSPIRQSYYCFGCGEKGDIFSFVEKYEGLDFKGALQSLADRAGITLSHDVASRKSKDEIVLVHTILEEATLYFESQLALNDEALGYLKTRGLTSLTIKNFRIGFAPHSWDSLRSHLSKKGFSDEDAYKAGLLKKKEQRYYDAFRSRIMFPISSGAGKVIGFSGRIFGDESEAKYLNSPETEVFQKSEVLFGFDKAKQDIRKKDYCLLVEGQFDLVMAHQSGFTNAIASSGTAFGEKALSLIGRITKNLLLVFDADSAGIGASGRVARIALPLGFNVKSALLPKGSDPAEILLKEKEKFVEAIKGSKHIIDFYMDLLEKAGYDERKYELEVRKIVLPYVALIENKLDQAYFVRKIADKLKTPEIAVWNELAKVEQSPVIRDKVQDSEITSNSLNLEKLTISFKKYLDSKGYSDLSLMVASRYREIMGLEIPDPSPDDERLLFEIEAMGITSDEERLTKEMIDRFELNILSKRHEELTRQLKESELRGEEESATKYLKEIQEISKKMESVKRS